MSILFRQLIRFGLAGAFNTVVAYLLFSLLLFLGMHYTFATLLGGLAGWAVGYRTTGNFAFNYHGESRIFAFTGIFILLFFINIGIQRTMQPFVNPYVGGGVATTVCFLASFTLNRGFVFRPAQEERPLSYNTAYAETQIKRSSNSLRRMIRYFYLRDIARYTEGATIDMGCGSGDMLSFLPEGSVGLEVNPAAVEYGRSIGLQVFQYDPEVDGYSLESIPPGPYQTILFTHVLEHLERPDQVLETIFRSCVKIGIQHVVLTLPCEKGFKFDPTHRTFIDEVYLRGHSLLDRQDFVPTVIKYFPFDVKCLGRIYTYHELRVVFVRNKIDCTLEANPTCFQ